MKTTASGEPIKSKCRIIQFTMTEQNKKFRSKVEQDFDESRKQMDLLEQ